MRKDKRRMKGAQHKRPGAQARRQRQQDAHDRLVESQIFLAESHAAELQSLRRTLGYPEP